MITRKTLMFVIGGLAWLTVLSPPVSAEWLADFHVGPAFTQDDDIDDRATLAILGVNTRLKDVEFDNSVSLGGRFGHWFNAWPYLGLALDVSHFRPDIENQTVTATVLGVDVPGTPVASVDIQVTEINFDVMLRYPLLTSNEFPNGQLQPYFTVGPGIFIARAEDSTNFVPNDQSETDTSAGVKAGAGVAWQFHRNVALFGEYRFTHFEPEFDFNNLGAKGTVETDVDTHRAVFGISYRF